MLPQPALPTFVTMPMTSESAPAVDGYALSNPRSMYLRSPGVPFALGCVTHRAFGKPSSCGPEVSMTRPKGTYAEIMAHVCEPQEYPTTHTSLVRSPVPAESR